MSFRYHHFDTSFNLELIDYTALTFERLASRLGWEILLKIKSNIGIYDYGDPLFSWTETGVKGFIENDSSEGLSQAGYWVKDNLLVYLPVWNDVEQGWELVIKGTRYVVTSFEKTRAYLKVKAERRKEQ